MGRIIRLVLLVCLLAACGSVSDEIVGPQIVSEVTLGPPTSPPPARILSPTPLRLTPEIVSPLEVVTVEADFVLVTPTLPPSKTPTLTPTHTLTPTQTLTPTMTVTASATAFLLPTSIILPLTQPVAQPDNRVCDSTWFFIQPRPPGCPLNPPNVSQGVYQEFENGYMVWVGSQDAIYVLYNDTQQPRWQVFRDYFVEGMAEASSQYASAPRPGIWQPRRGFGLLWRDNAPVRERAGWATQELEQPFSVSVQTGVDGTIFISQPQSGVFGLLPGGANWQDYSGSTASTLPVPAIRTPGQPLAPGSVPLPTVRPGS